MHRLYKLKARRGRRRATIKRADAKAIRITKDQREKKGGIRSEAGGGEGTRKRRRSGRFKSENQSQFFGNNNH